jgi:hypothetical protein
MIKCKNKLNNRNQYFFYWGHGTIWSLFLLKIPLEGIGVQVCWNLMGIEL